MSDENKSSSNPSGREPTATRSTAPIWIIVTTLLLLFVGGYYFDQHSGWFNDRVYSPYKSSDQLDAFQPQSGEAARLARGKKTYEAVCGICHGVDGLGKPNQAPPLAGSELVDVTGFNRLLHIPLAGVNGPITVSGKDWSLAMPAMGAALSDEDLAAVMTYIRSSWGNKVGPVTAADVKKVRAALGAGPQPMNGPALMKMEE